MIQTQKCSFRAAFDRFREIVRSLRGLDGEGQVPFLKYELLQALERADEHQERGRDLERQLDELRARGTQLPLAVGGGTDVTASKDAYQEKLQIAESAYHAVKRRCTDLEERCQSLLVTIERAAFGDGEEERGSATIVGASEGERGGALQKSDPPVGPPSQNGGDGVELPF